MVNERNGDVTTPHGGIRVSMASGKTRLGTATVRPCQTARGGECYRAGHTQAGAGVGRSRASRLTTAGLLSCMVRRSKRRHPAEVKIPDNARTIELPGTTLLPGLIDAHTHVLLHPYDEALWDDQVLKEALALRVCRATNHLRQIL